MGHPTSAVAARRFIHHRRTACFTAPPDLCSVTDHGVGVPRRQEVEFSDGSRLWLLRVEKHQGVPELFLRELSLPAGGVVIDLRKLVPELERDLPVANSRDVPGIVHFSLRGRFHTAQNLVDAALVSGSPD